MEDLSLRRNLLALNSNKLVLFRSVCAVQHEYVVITFTILLFLNVNYSVDYRIVFMNREIKLKSLL